MAIFYLVVLLGIPFLLRVVHALLNSVQALLHTGHAPFAALALGGDIRREHYAIQLMRTRRELQNSKLYISSGDVRPTASVLQTLRQDRVVIDHRAVDTLSNFTTLVDNFVKEGIRHVVIITTAEHAPRAHAIAFIVLGSKRISSEIVRVLPGSNDRVVRVESRLRIVRDVLRALLWVATGWSARHIALWLHPDRACVQENEHPKD